MSEKVKRKFRDKFTKKIYEKGDSYSGDADRVAFLVEKDFLEKSKQPPKKEEKPKKKADKK